MRSLLLASVFPVLLATAACGPKKGGGDDDETPPEVESTVPANGATGVSVLSVLRATFDESVEESTITEETFRLTFSTGGALVPGTVTLDGSDTAEFTPDAALDPATSYTAILTDDITDTDGNALAAQYSWGFTTTSGEFVLASDDVASGGIFPADNTCAGANFSPELHWTPAAGALSWAMTLIDTDNDVIHWVIWDIPVGTTSLEVSIPNDAMPNPPGGGAKQVRSYDSATYGYLGPCPVVEFHTYEFRVYAMDVATLPGVTTSSTRAEALAAVEAHELESAFFTADSDASP